MRANVRDTLKRIPGLVPAVRFVKNQIYDHKSIAAFRAEQSIQRKGPIKVGFFCQYIPAWAKVETIYQMMREDPRFEPYLICLPSQIQNNQLENPDSLENDTYTYFLAHGYSEAINALVGRNTWMDLEKMDLSYIFYPRPYNAHFPPQYTTHNVAKYSKICLLMYGMEITEDITATSLNRDFMSHAAYYFAENSAVANVNIRNNQRAHNLGLQHTVCVGVPVLESLDKKRGAASSSWAFSKNAFRVMWTPRWTTDVTLGGSNFFTYYQELPQYAKEHPDVDFLFRPHPLAFAHFIETGEMTEQEVNKFKQLCEETPNISLDKEPQYDATLWASSVLISDYSGMVPEYFYTGKPLIFCMSNMLLTLSDFGRRMMEGCYVVNNAEELFHCVNQLRIGEDPLREKRLSIIEELFGNNEGACARILDELAK